MLQKKYLTNNIEKELEAIMGILKLKRGILSNSGWPEKIKKTPFQTKVLQEIFKITEFPSTTTRKNLAILLFIPHRSIQVWFQNTRQAKKKQKGCIPESYITSYNSSETENEDISLTQLVKIINTVNMYANWHL